MEKQRLGGKGRGCKIKCGKALKLLMFLETEATTEKSSLQVEFTQIWFVCVVFFVCLGFFF